MVKLHCLQMLSRFNFIHCYFNLLSNVTLENAYTKNEQSLYTNFE